jgi:putative tryptophan/tyrosine transport system substrate-binding protein
MDHRMRRRELITLIGGAMALPRVVLAQPAKLYRIGVLLLGTADADSFKTQMREGLGKSGFIEKQNLVFEIRSAEGRVEVLPSLAAELVALKVDVLVALLTPCALAAQKATSEIPIVVVSGDPLGTGLVKSLSHPGANVTGISLMGSEMHGKCVELFRDIFPSLSRVAVLLNAKDPFSRNILEQVELAGRTTGIEIAPSVMVREPGEVDAAFAAMKNEGARDAGGYSSGADLNEKRHAPRRRDSRRAQIYCWQKTTSLDVRSLVAIGGKADVAVTSADFRV